ncbi:TIM barrel protein [Rhizobium sp. FKY42]|uniref:hydroxypyruvate isomerase family protein n=1 Tax=Rhizobium sp. FKY42 TaxID=2562310 RepID=UPI0010C04DB7|nr:TIM barrel protein [Rhizobium sp. FKY42]
MAIRFSANLGFLWQELTLPDAIRAAKSAGFDAVECHWPYNESVDRLKTALDETGLPMLGLNTVRGKVEAGENGLTALPGRELEAQTAIRQALDYSVALDVPNIHVMAGKASGEMAHATYVANLTIACELAAAQGKTILIEPLNSRDAPDYFLSTTAQAVSVIEEVGHANLKIMFDCYHVQIMEGDLCRRFERLMPHIGHVQIAAVPDRGEPDSGEIDYPYVLSRLAFLGWDHPVGAEYRPRATTDAGLGWMSKFERRK